eukprot:bmy_07494T0
MLSDELEIKPELLVQFVQNTSIPLGQGLVESEAKDITCLSLLPVAEASECSRLMLPDNTLNILTPPRSCVEKPSGEGGSRQRRDEGSDCREASGVFVNSRSLGSSAEHLVFVQDEAKDSGNDFLSSESTDSSIPWILRVRELAHDSLIAATRAQLAKNAKTSSNGEIFWAPSSNGEEAKCTVEGCDQTFVWPAYFKYHLKTDRNDRSFICPAAGCGKSFYVLQRLKVHMRTHNGEKPFMCPESNCGEKPFLCEAQGCGSSFGEYSSLPKHLVFHSGEKPHQCQVRGKTSSRSGSRYVHVRKHHLQMGAAGSQEPEQTNEPLMGSRLLEEASVTTSLGGESLKLPNTDSILGVDDEVLTEGSPCPLSSVPDVTHHLVTMQSWRQPCEVSVSTAIDPQESLNQGDLTDRQT